jgi:hypothetical protein
MNNQRSAPRIEVTLPARWEGVLDKHEASITSLSTDGCFVLSGGEVSLGELISIEIDLPEQETVFCWGEVSDLAPEIGFAVRFTTLDEGALERLAEFISLSPESPVSS